MHLLNCDVCGKKKSAFIKNKELHNFSSISNGKFKMKKIINRLLLTAGKFMPELNLKQPGFTYSACGPFNKHCERIPKFREADNLYRNELNKASFDQDTAYSDSKDLAQRIISDKILKERAYESARTRGYDGYQRALASTVDNFWEKKTGSGAIVTSKVRASVNEQLAEELYKPVIKQFKRRKVYVRIKDNV